MPTHIYLIIVIAVFIALIATPAIVVPVAINSSKRKRLNKKYSNGESWVFALGEKDNIKDITATRSRLIAVLIDNEKIDKDLLKKLGATSILVMSNKVTLLIEERAEQVAASIQKDL